MLKIIKNMKNYKVSVIFIILLLFVQAICDLALPTYTSDLIDTGINGSGIEYAVPQEIRPEQYQALSLFMTDTEKEKWQSAYTLSENGNYKLRESSKKAMEEYDACFKTPIAVFYTVSKTTEQSGLSDSGQMTQSPEALSQTCLAIRTEIEKSFESMGEAIVHSSAVAFIKEEYAAAGVDINAVQSAYLWKVGAFMLGMTLLMVASASLVGLLASRVGAGIGRDLRENVFKKVMSFSSIEMNQFSTASLITRSTNDIQQVQMVSVMLLRMVFYSPILAIGGIIMVLRTNTTMEWIIVLAVVLILLVVALLVAIAMPKFKLMQTLVDKVNLVSREILTGLSVIRAFGREKLEEERFDRANRDLTKTMLFTNRAMTFMMPTMMLIMNGVSVLIVWVSSKKIDAGMLQVGSMTAFITYTMMIVMSFLMLTMISIMAPRAAVAAGRIDEVLSTETEIKDGSMSMPKEKVKGVLSFQNVSFKYPGAEEYVLENICFDALPGKTTAIIGSTGSGKSTLVNLIPRFYDVTDGQILLDGADIRNIREKDLRDCIGYVPQKAILFSGTIESNLRYGAADAPEQTVKEAADIAQATDFIEAKDDKYQSPIAQGGTNVSGGQKQRLSIARAIAKDPKIYIFDDSFSALDYKTDTALRKALSQKVKDKTVIIVAQRISTILYADQILVLDDGKIAGCGTHTQLMQTCEVYAQIAKSQLSEKELAKDFSKKEESDHE